MPRDFGRGRSGVPRQWRRAEGHTGAAALARQSWPPPPPTPPPAPGGGGGPGCRGSGDVPKATPGLPHWQGSPGPRAVTDPAHARKHFAREPGDPASFFGPPSGEPPQSASGSPGAYDDESGTREVGSWRSTEEAGEQSCGCNPCGGGVGGGKAASQGKCQRSAHAPDSEPTL